MARTYRKENYRQAKEDRQETKKIRKQNKKKQRQYLKDLKLLKELNPERKIPK